MRNLKRVVASTMLGIMLMGSTSVFAFEVQVNHNHNKLQPSDKQIKLEGTTMIFPEGTTRIRGYVNEERYYSRLAEKIIIPDSVTKIDGAVLSNYNVLKEVKMSKNIKEIETMAFKGNKYLESIELPEGLEILGKQAFEGCSNLKSINIPGTVKRLEGFVLAYTKVEELRLNEGLEIMDINSLASIERVYIPDSVKTIHPDAGMTRLEVHAKTGSVGHKYAISKGLKFISTGVMQGTTPPVVMPPVTKPPTTKPPVTKPPVVVAPAKVVKATPTASKVKVNGKVVAFDAYNINGNNYFKIRDIAFALNGTNKQFNVEWVAYNQSINFDYYSNYVVLGGEMAKGDGKVKEGKLNNARILIQHGSAGELEMTAYNIGGNNYVKLRDMGKARNFGVTWNGSSNTIDIDTNSKYVAE